MKPTRVASCDSGALSPPQLTLLQDTPVWQLSQVRRSSWLFDPTSTTATVTYNPSFSSREQYGLPQRLLTKKPTRERLGRTATRRITTHKRFSVSGRPSQIQRGKDKPEIVKTPKVKTKPLVSVFLAQLQQPGPVRRRLCKRPTPLLTAWEN